jgi:protein-tyrosine phosphatase
MNYKWFDNTWVYNTKEKFSLTYSCPIDTDAAFNEILPFVYVGNSYAAVSMFVREWLPIARILTVGKTPMDEETRNGLVRYDFVQVADDYPLFSILPCIKLVFKAIDEAQRAKQSILIYCNNGRSLAPSIVAAYIMWKHNKTLIEASYIVLRKRAAFHPSSGMIQQLLIAQKHGFELNVRSDAGRKILLGNLFYMGKNEMTRKFALDFYFAQSAQSDENESEMFTCEMCFHPLFHRYNLLFPHFHNQSCKFLYIEPLRWMITQGIGGSHLARNLRCPKCSTIIGNYDWSGTGCIKCPVHINISKQFTLVRVHIFH